MVTFIKKVKAKEGINFFDLEKVKKSIPAGYKASVNEPTITLTANHALIAYKCEKTAQPATAPKPKASVKKKKNAAPAKAKLS